MTPNNAQSPDAEELLEPIYRPDTPVQSFCCDLYSWLQPILFALVLLFLVSTFVGRVIGVDGESMMPTLHDGDKVILQTLGYTPKAGDVVVLTKRSYSDTPIIKRVIATEGQSVDLDYQANTVTVTDVDGSRRVLDEPYLGESMRTPSWSTVSHIDVPQGSICVLGDNRNNSTDSRSPLVGTVDTRCVLGRAVWIFLPFQDFGVIDK